MNATSTPVRICPKCGHVRGETEVAPAWQCPACGIAYNKYQAYLARAKQAMIPPGRADAEPAWTDDGSIWTLLAANGLSLAAAIYNDWSTVSLMLLYWSQSVIIGISNVFRILTLDRFSTENFRINNRRVEPTTGTKWQVAIFFALHYGFFHLVYMMFLLTGSKGEPLLVPGFWACMLAFAVNHIWSYHYNRELDRKGTPNIGTLMFTPYLRIIPMHLTIIFGGLFAQSRVSLILFGLLKTIADAGMHLVEHRQIKKVREVRPG